MSPNERPPRSPCDADNLTSLIALLSQPVLQYLRIWIAQGVNVLHGDWTADRAPKLPASPHALSRHKDLRQAAYST